MERKYKTYEKNRGEKLLFSIFASLFVTNLQQKKIVLL